MVKKYNYSNCITKENQRKVIKLVDSLIKSGHWSKDLPTFQTYSDLHFYEELEIFKKTFIQSCHDYLNVKQSYDYLNINLQHNYEIFMSCYRDNRFNSRKKGLEDLWHRHNMIDETVKVSGIYYLKNPRKEGTEFMDFKLEVEPYTWYIFPSDLMHRPPRIKSFRNRYTITADFKFNS